ncbi:aromatase/cyclase [Streptomyces sp. NPDC055036]
MPENTEHHEEHGTDIAAPAESVHALIADVGQWPRIFPPTLHAEVVERAPGSERIRIWATANGEVKVWTSRRTLDRERLRIGFRQEISQSPVAAMSGEWLIRPLPDGGCHVGLSHTFRSVDDSAESVAWIRRAIDTNSGAELTALRTAAERRSAQGLLELSFEDVLPVDGPPKAVYDFLYEADRWGERLPHVARVELVESTPSVQSLEMDTRSPDGTVHTTRAVRICRPYESIVYKQLRTPALLSVHIGRWTVREEAAGTVLSSAHTVVIDPTAVPRILGQGATVADARAFARDALGRNSMATMRRAKEYAERYRG